MRALCQHRLSSMGVLSAREDGYRTHRIHPVNPVPRGITPGQAPHASPVRQARISTRIAVPHVKQERIQARPLLNVRVVQRALTHRSRIRTPARPALPIPGLLPRLHYVSSVLPAHSPTLVPPAAVPVLTVLSRQAAVAVIHARPVTIPMPITRLASSARQIPSPRLMESLVLPALKGKQTITIIQNVSTNPEKEPSHA